jgi:hypothetical protein
MPLMLLRGRLSYATRLDGSYAMKTIGNVAFGLCHGVLLPSAANLTWPSNFGVGVEP